MKRLNKKIAFVLAMVMIGTLSLTMFQVSATANVEEKCICPAVEYTYEGMDASKAEQIVNLMMGNAVPQRGNIFCIFGHDKKTGTITLTEHYYYSTDPKCKKTTSSVEYCTRDGCDYYVVTGQSINRVPCH